MAKSINAILLVLAAVLVVPAASYAAGLGTITVRSALGQPLDAEIEVVSLQPGDDFQVRLATRDAYREAGIDLSPALQGARFAVEKRDGKTVIRVRTTQPVNDPFFSILVEMQWPTGRLARQYTVLVDPVEYRTASAPSTQAAAPAPVVTPKPTPAPARAQVQPPKAIAQAPTPAPVAAAAPAATPAPVSAPTQAPAVAAAPVSAPTLAEPINAAPERVAASAAAPAAPIAAEPGTSSSSKAAPVAAPKPISAPHAAAEATPAPPTPAPVAAAPLATAPASVQPAPSAVAPAAPSRTEASAAKIATSANPTDTYLIKRGDTLGAIARKWKPEGVTYEQMLIGLYQTNRPVFIRDNINLIRAGATLFIPGREDVLAVGAADAAHQVRMQMAAFTKYRDSAASAGTGSSRISQAQREVISRRPAVKKSPRAL